jgi:hypothetical protein
LQDNTSIQGIKQNFYRLRPEFWDVIRHFQVVHPGIEGVTQRKHFLVELWGVRFEVDFREGKGTIAIHALLLLFNASRILGN